MLSKGAFSRVAVAVAGAAVALIVAGGVTPASAAHDNSHGKSPERAETNHAAAEHKAEGARSGSGKASNADNAGDAAARPEQKPSAAGRDGAATPADNRARPQAGATKRPGKTGVKSGPAPAEGKGDAARGKQTKGHEAKARQGKGNHGEPNPPKHDPVTVCHLLGNGSYIELTFDDNALDAHLAHDDLHPVPAGGCPGTAENTSGSTGKGHTPVTVCHLLGNGSYNMLTFDDSALKAHIAHGDLYPAPTAGCPAEENTTGAPGTTVPGTSDGDADRTEGFVNEVAGVSQEIAPEAGDRVDAVAEDMVLGVEQPATANRPAATLARSAGLLPQTGARQVALLVVAGLGALAAGAALLGRRRLRTAR